MQIKKRYIAILGILLFINISAHAWFWEDIADGVVSAGEAVQKATGTYYPQPQVKNNSPYRIQGQIKKAGCATDVFDIAPGQTWTATSNRGSCLITSLSGSFVGSGQNFQIVKYDSTGTGYWDFQVTAYSGTYRIFSRQEYANVADIRQGKSPGFYFVNYTAWPISYSLDQVGCLHHGIVPTGAYGAGGIMKADTGAVWFTLRMHLQPDGQNPQSDWDCVEPVADLVGDVALAALTGGVAAATKSAGKLVVKTVVKAAIKKGLKKGAKSVASMLIKDIRKQDLGKMLTDDGSVVMVGQYAGYEWPFRCDKMPEYHITGGPEILVDEDGDSYISEGVPFTVTKVNSCGNDMMLASPRKVSAKQSDFGVAFKQTSSASQPVVTTPTTMVQPMTQDMARMLPGSYVHTPPSNAGYAQNDWHIGTIVQDANGFRWSNKAGTGWRLTADLPNGKLQTGTDNPYFAQGLKAFDVVVSNGQITGFRFGNSYYARQAQPSVIAAPQPVAVIPTNTVLPISQDMARMLPGSYVHTPPSNAGYAQNDWHIGTIVQDANGFRWSNKAGTGWRLTADLPNGKLQTGTDNPYFAQGLKAFDVVVSNGQITGFRFGNSYYARQAQPSVIAAPQPVAVIPTNTVLPISQDMARMLPGSYVHTPPSNAGYAQNDWHIGTIVQDANGFRWSNKAGTGWRLTADLPNGKLQTGTDNPYFAQGLKAFDVVVSNGQITGFRFGNSYYARQAQPSVIAAPQPVAVIPTNTVLPISQDMARMLPGSYVHTPPSNAGYAQNDWHIGTIVQDANGFRWSNKAGTGWRLTADLPNGKLQTGTDNPYFAQGLKAFDVVVSNGQITGFRFGNSYYARQAQPSVIAAPQAIAVTSVATTATLPPRTSLSYLQIAGGVAGNRQYLSVNQQCGLTKPDLKPASSVGFSQNFGLMNMGGDIYQIVVQRADANCAFKYLSVAADCNVRTVDMYQMDDGSARQRWQIRYDSKTNTSQVINVWRAQNCKSGASLLSASADGAVVDLWTVDDMSGRQRWRMK